MGTHHEGNQIAEVLVSHYTEFLGMEVLVHEVNLDGLFTNVLSGEAADHMVSQVSREEVKSAMFSIGEDKAPDRGPTRCAFKIDIQKAYDTVNWSFLKDILIRFGFHQKMVGWIMTCVSTVSYSLSINGNLHGYFRGKRGLRQGDPMSPYLFTLIMEILSCLLQQAASSPFRYHAHCAKQKIINVLFADDLFIFVHGDTVSVKRVKEALQTFTNISGLAPSLAKSTVFFCNVPHSIRQEILDIMPFQEGVFLASFFIIPTRVINELEKRIRRFLWNAGSEGQIRAKVAWKDVCLPKQEGGLGIRSISDVNKSLMAMHVWSILTKRESIWVRWIHEYKLKGRNFWEVPSRGSMSWGWRKILSIRSIVRPHIWNKLKTQDRLAVWEAGSETNLNLMCCPLCHYDRDSRDHLFFQCVFADQVWANVKGMVNLDSVDNTWESLMVCVYQYSNSKTVDDIVCKLVVVATTYYIWQERNSRLFTSNQLTVLQVAEKIKSSVRLRLMGFKFRLESARRRIFKIWKISDSKDGEPDPG
ncbi:uncharacterized protein LOC110933740 [Helianthus annuus]|uniref:uncharacterized protein LOC110933740 n=1 Tax=Helianthus annuus TaxID=4232 RepID=UPI000B8F3AAB|nr:uncharacterized protein LOC110933740 [Helianthus annuus]